MIEKLEQILTAREQRADRIRRAQLAYPGHYIISLKLNIPGPDKVTTASIALLKIAMELLECSLLGTDLQIRYRKSTSSAAGPEAIYALLYCPQDGRETTDTTPASATARSEVDFVNNAVANSLASKEHNYPSSLRQKIKLLLVKIEETDPLGRLFDFDLWYEGKQIKRSELGLPARRCLICSDFAIICSKEQRHTLRELQLKIDALLRADPRIKLE
ncbi:MAG TPA: hypothetical protein GXX72_06700 [Clostridiaceae bacterium]|nr:hypothetical protein [Clostridiaceae bacterium]